MKTLGSRSRRSFLTGLALAFASPLCFSVPTTFYLDTLIDVLPGNEISQTAGEPCFIGDPSCNNDSPTSYTQIPTGVAGVNWDLKTPDIDGDGYRLGDVRDKVGNGFFIGIDVNTTVLKSERLDKVEFRIWNPEGGSFDTPDTIYTTRASGDGGVEGTIIGDAQDLANGTGKSDWVLGQIIDITNFDADWRIQGRVVQSNSVDGREQYFAIPEARLVPVPAAAWLFGSGLIGLIGVSRRRKSAGSMGA